MLVLVYALLGAFSITSNYVTIALSQRLVNDFRAELHAQLRASRSPSTVEREVGDLIDRLTTDTCAIQTLAMNGVFALSAGEQLRITIARAFLCDAPILLLDEPTSALDAATEARGIQGLETLMTGRMTFVIAHRLSTVRRADTILVLKVCGYCTPICCLNEAMAWVSRYIPSVEALRNWGLASTDNRGHKPIVLAMVTHGPWMAHGLLLGTLRHIVSTNHDNVSGKASC